MVFESICEHPSSPFIFNLRARPVISFLMQAASTLEIANEEQWALRTSLNSAPAENSKTLFCAK